MRLAALVWMMLGTALAGAFVIVVVSVPSLYEKGMTLIPWAVAAGAVVAVPFAVIIARRIDSATRSAA